VNDGIVSTASLALGVAATHATHSNVLVTGVTGLVAGAMAMAAGEYVSVHSQEFMGEEDIVGDVFGFELVATDGAVG
jgi:VIT1/CCC1 family predicted Fe2+/Mn2+ transporter